MAQIKFANNVSTQLIKSVAENDSTIEVRSLTQGLVWPNISATGDYFLIVIDDVSASTWEIMKCTKVQVSGNTTILTVERGLEGTTATTFNAGSVVENRLTAGTLNTFGEGFPAKVEITRGGTGATTAADARTNLDVPSKADLSSEISTRTSEVARLDQKIVDNIPPAATTSVRGTTTLSSAVDSVSETLAATPKAVKTAYDAAVSAKYDVDTVDARVTDEVNTLTANIEAVQSSCAPTSHASSETTYGLATDANYGHVRSDGDTTNIVAGEVVVKDVAINGDVTNSASKRGQIGDVQVWSSITDFDAYTTQGVFGGYWEASANNSPTSYGCTGFIEVLSNSDNTRLVQRVHCLQISGIKPVIIERAYRSEYGWSSWVQTIDSTNLATTSTPGLVKSSTTAAAGAVPLGGADGTLDKGWFGTLPADIAAVSSNVNTLTTNFNALVTNINSLATVAERVNSSGDNWIRYESGIQLCWGEGGTNAYSGLTVTLPVPYANDAYYISLTTVGSNSSISAQVALYAERNALTSFTVWAGAGGGAAPNTGFLYFTIGRWK